MIAKSAEVGFTSAKKPQYCRHLSRLPIATGKSVLKGQKPLRLDCWELH